MDRFIFGGKAAKLCLAVRSGLPVPGGFALSYGVVEQIINGNDEVMKLLNEHLSASTTNVCVRSSAVDEDDENSSYAGIYQSFLNVIGTPRVMEAVHLVARSGHAAPAIAYRAKQGQTTPSPVAIVIQQMIFADCSGVLLTRHPVTGNDERVIEACWGLGESIAAGRIIPDLYTVSRGTVDIQINIGSKETAVYPDKRGGTIEISLEEHLKNKACLTEDQLKRLEQLAASCELIFGKDLDIEWAISDNELYLLQCRKITA
ncbi:PEP/pyruvate-binding domain-containing protein [Paenibacillus tarimensis]